MVSVESKAEWTASLSGARDFYHLPFYNSLVQALGQGEPKLFVYRNGEYTISLPLLIRRIEHIRMEEFGNEQWFDASSVYGYAGPIVSHASIPKTVTIDFQDRLMQMLSEMRVVSVFSRLHPLMSQEPILEGLGSMVFHGHTVSIDLTTSEETQLAQYRENHRRGLKKIAKAGATCIVDEKFSHLDKFIEIYTATMHRVGATEEYIFPKSYFTALAETDEAEVKLIVCTIGSEVACAGIFILCGDILQYHLGGTSDAWLQHSPMKLVLDTARHWGYVNGAKVLHLGGGVGTRDDSLFQFKLGFSNRLHAFKTWRWVLLQSVYDQLVRLSEVNAPANYSSDTSGDYFPRYRSVHDTLSRRLSRA